MSLNAGTKTTNLDLKPQIRFSQLLAVDTATKACSVAISRGDILAAEMTMVNRQTHSRHLLSMIQHVLARAQLKLSDLDGFVVTKGPGSFTGLRIGVSTVKGLAMAVGRPLVGVSYLKCLAAQSGVTNGLVCVVVDARRSECYYALYRFGGSGLQTVVPDSVGSIEQVTAIVSEPCTFIGNGAQSYRKHICQELGRICLFLPDFFNILRAYTQIWIGRNRLLSGNDDHLENLVPEYIRKSDAQINLAKKALARSTAK